MPEFDQLLIGTIVTLLRVYLIYWMYCGWFEVKKAGDKIWTAVYSFGAFIYIAYANASSLGVDAVHPIRIFALIGGILVIKMLVLALAKKNKEI